MGIIQSEYPLKVYNYYSFFEKSIERSTAYNFPSFAKQPNISHQNNKK
jgi:hypothetical protein